MDPNLSAVIALVCGLYLIRLMNQYGHIGRLRGCGTCGAPEGKHWPSCPENDRKRD